MQHLAENGWSGDVGEDDVADSDDEKGFSLLT